MYLLCLGCRIRPAHSRPQNGPECRWSAASSPSRWHSSHSSPVLRQTGSSQPHLCRPAAPQSACYTETGADRPRSADALSYAVFCLPATPRASCLHAGRQFVRHLQKALLDPVWIIRRCRCAGRGWRQADGRGHRIDRVLAQGSCGSAASIPSPRCRVSLSLQRRHVRIDRLATRRSVKAGRRARPGQAAGCEWSP